MPHVFISYARENSSAADRLYLDLTSAGYVAWLDRITLPPGLPFRPATTVAIREAAAFVALLSAHSLGQRGYVQRELKEALQVLAEVPANQVFLIPARLEDVRPQNPELDDLTWVDLFPDYDGGLQRILSALATIPELATAVQAAPPASRNAPLPSAPISSMDDLFRVLIEALPQSTALLDTRYAYFVTFRTDVPGVAIPARLRPQYPSEMKIVLQHQYRDLVVTPDAFSVVLWFSGVEERVTVPFKAVTVFECPEASVNLKR